MSAPATRRLVRGGALALGAAATAGTATAAWGATVGLHGFRLRRATVAVLPPETPTLRVLHLSDLHLLPRQRRKRQFVAALDRLHPHLVVNTGDNIAAADALPALLDTLGPLLRRPGCFVFGSNDFSSPVPANPFAYLLPAHRRRRHHQDTDLPADEVAAAFTGAGWVRLDNAAGAVTARGADLPHPVEVAVAGTADAHIGADELGTVPAAPAGRPAIAVTHAPYTRVLDTFRDLGWPLLLAGHTHGGQLCLPGERALISNSDLPPAQASGLSRWPTGDPDGMALHVSAGLGTSPWVPVRLNCPPEATLLRLTAVPLSGRAEETGPADR